MTYMERYREIETMAMEAIRTSMYDSIEQGKDAECAHDKARREAESRIRHVTLGEVNPQNPQIQGMITRLLRETWSIYNGAAAAKAK